MNDEKTYSLRFLVEGPAACFKRPEFVEDFISYDVMTPLAARRVIRAAYVADANVQIDRISVLRPIAFQWGQIDERQLMTVENVAYLLSATVKLGSEISESLSHRYPHEPRDTFLGLRSLPAQIRRLRDDEAVDSSFKETGPVDLGWMIFDILGRGKARARYFRPTMIDGVIDVQKERSGPLVG